MDLSKLPKHPPENDVQPHAPAAPQSPTAGLPVTPRRTVEPGIGLEIWFGAIVGLLFVLLTRQFGVYLFDRATGRPYHTDILWMQGPNEGREVPYTELEGGTFYSDSAVFLFGAALLIEAGCLLVTRFIGALRPVVWLILLITLAAVAWNVVASVILLRDGITPVLSVLCIAIGGYMLYVQWNLLSSERPAVA